jgi:serine/threonine protein kinase SCH9
MASLLLHPVAHDHRPHPRPRPPSNTTNTDTNIATSFKSYFQLSLLLLKLDAMIKLWPSTPIGQTTPRAGPNGQLLEPDNPFDSPLPTPPPLGPDSGHHTPTSASYHHHLLHTHSLPSVSTQGPLTLSGIPPAAPPTTHLSLHAPEFNMQQPPVSAHQRQQHPLKSPSASSNNSLASSSSKGQIHVKLIQARSLHVRTVHARPYVVVQFEQNEFVSRDPTNETDKEVKGTATNLSRNGSSNALSALGAIGSKAVFDNVKRTKDSASSSSSSTSSSRHPSSSVAALPNHHTIANTLFGRPSAHNPVWKHEVSLSVSFFFSSPSSVVDNNTRSVM